MSTTLTLLLGLLVDLINTRLIHLESPTSVVGTWDLTVRHIEALATIGFPSFSLFLSESIDRHPLDLAIRTPLTLIIPFTAFAWGLTRRFPVPVTRRRRGIDVPALGLYPLWSLIGIVRVDVRAQAVDISLVRRVETGERSIVVSRVVSETLQGYLHVLVPQVETSRESPTKNGDRHERLSSFECLLTAYYRPSSSVAIPLSEKAL
jgi:hypothetical protein